ncbi:EF-hand domain-containing protein [Altererythrobacter sp. KTW20L]|uniref:EF-hand domain-containing protein n=1 Tax=Altererythrobacter sp. KTW20L TaxID=2942210 RepID=UPI0020BD62A0|nr:EF-hand domain-containing protein [Altererythrobacter sp. KTW20L]MCL6251976.1 EF-hand domain-containing protein [Altererythrobacter sp. KTW20L]
MNRVVLGAFVALLMVGTGLFWLQGRAQVEAGAPPPVPVTPASADDGSLPEADVAGLQGPAPPQSTRLTREEQRFFRYDTDRDRRITRNEMMSSRTAAFRALDTDGNNLLTFEEWAVTTSERFAGMDADGNGWLSPAEFATSAPRPRPTQTPRCNC